VPKAPAKYFKHMEMLRCSAEIRVKPPEREEWEHRLISFGKRYSRHYGLGASTKIQL